MEKAFQKIHNHSNGLGHTNDGALCQEFLSGTEYVIDGVSRDGVYKVRTCTHVDRYGHLVSRHFSPSVCFLLFNLSVGVHTLQLSYLYVSTCTYVRTFALINLLAEFDINLCAFSFRLFIYKKRSPHFFSFPG